MSIIKKMLVSIVIGLVGYEITKLTLDGGLQLPATTPEISLLLIFILTALAASLTATGLISVPQSSAGYEGTSDREEGTVKWFNVRKGYGFITRDLGDDVFVHFRNIESNDRRGLSEGQRVSFIVTSGEKGPQADQVNPA